MSITEAFRLAVIALGDDAPATKLANYVTKNFPRVSYEPRNIHQYRSAARASVAKGGGGVKLKAAALKNPAISAPVVMTVESSTPQSFFPVGDTSDDASRRRILEDVKAVLGLAKRIGKRRVMEYLDLATEQESFAGSSSAI